MKVSMINSSNESKSLNVLDKNCLKGTDTFDYIGEDDSEKLFSIDENNNQVAEVEACLSKEKAGLQIVRMRTKDKNLEMQKEALQEFTNYVWGESTTSMNHLVLAIHVLIEGSGMPREVLEPLGFVGKSGEGSILYTLLNPNYMELVETFAADEAAVEKLTKFYEIYQKRKDTWLKRFEKQLENGTLYLSECKSQKERDYVQTNIDYCTEVINSLGAKEQSSKHL